MQAVLGIGGFDLARALEYKPTFLEPEYPFEWAGAFELAAGDYSLNLQEGPDPSIEALVCQVLPEDQLDPLQAAERVFTRFSAAAGAQSPGAIVTPSLKVHQLELPETGGSQFTVRIPEAGRYWLFTEHLPSEFSLQLLDVKGQPANALVEHNFDPGHSHDERVGSFSIEATRPINANRFQAWLSDVLKTHGTQLYRMKGFLNFAGANDRIVIQGVHMVVDTTTLGPWGDASRRTQLVFIGRELDREAISAGFAVCLE
jgi:hypothetical protein